MSGKTIIIGGKSSLLPDPLSDTALKLEQIITNTADNMRPTDSAKVLHKLKTKMLIKTGPSAIEVTISGEGEKIR